MKSRIKIIVNGRVQGVGFRWFIAQKASEVSLTGLVRNLQNGSVEIIAEGEKEHLQQLAQISQKGPTFAKVREIETSWGDYTGEFETFEITH